MDTSEGDKYGVSWVDPKVTLAGSWEFHEISKSYGLMEAIIAFRKKHQKKPQNWTVVTGRIWVGPIKGD